MTISTNQQNHSMSLSRYQTTVGNRPSPQYCLARPNGVLTPLIPADELPPEVLPPQGFPRILSEHEARQLNLQCVGEFTDSQHKIPPLVTARFSHYAVMQVPHQIPLLRFHPTTNEPKHSCRSSNTIQVPLSRSTIIHTSFASPDSFYSGTASSLVTSSSAPPPRTQDVVLAQHDGTSPQQALMIYENNSRRPLPPSGIEPDLRKKEFCQFWIRHGQCDFMQQGCLYKHEMPPLPVLKEIMGMNSFPRWWMEEKIDNERDHAAQKRVVSKANRPLQVNPRNLAAIGSEREAGMKVATGLQKSKHAQKKPDKQNTLGSVHLIDFDDDPTNTHPSKALEPKKSTFSTAKGFPEHRVDASPPAGMLDFAVVRRFVAQESDSQKRTSGVEVDKINDAQKATAIKEATDSSRQIEDTTTDGISDSSHSKSTKMNNNKNRKSRRSRKFSGTAKSTPEKYSSKMSK